VRISVIADSRIGVIADSRIGVITIGCRDRPSGVRVGG